MLQRNSFFKKRLILLSLLFSVQLLFATEPSFIFIENKGQMPQNIQAKVNLPGGALFVENGAFTYHFYNQKKLVDIHNLRTNDRSMDAHAFKVVFKNQKTGGSVCWQKTKQKTTT